MKFAGVTIEHLNADHMQDIGRLQDASIVLAQIFPNAPADALLGGAALLVAEWSGREQPKVIRGFAG